jgi:D-3-phosphoglycerate dehydrogenase
MEPKLKRVLVTNIMMLNERERFDREIRDRGYFPVWATVEQYLSEAQCLDLVGDIDGWLAGDDRITRLVLERALPRLKVISKWGTGIDSIDLEAARDLGVPVKNSPAAFAGAVAEVALYFMLSLGRQLVEVDRGVRAGHWPKPQGQELHGRTLGLIGFGAIGRRIGELALAFGMKVIFYDPFVTAETPLGGSVAHPRSVEALAAESDYLCLACSYNKGNHHIVNDALLQKMKPGAFVINVARGPLVDQQALVAALQQGRVAGAGLDVFEIEPLPANDPLMAMSNVILGSHNANNGRAAVEHVHLNTLNNLTAVLG